jgi:hypothetical protein
MDSVVSSILEPLGSVETPRKLYMCKLYILDG